jgi:hypothetical protein
LGQQTGSHEDGASRNMSLSVDARNCGLKYLT